MVNKRMIAKGAALLACAVLMSGPTAAAEEKRLGDYIYVPAMLAQSATGTIGLRVEGLALEQGGDEPVVIDALAGAQFGVYVFSGDGELTPWANPLYPSEQMRIRTGEGETRFTLPQGAEYYLRQESAPQGYLFDETALIPVTGEEIVVRNAMAGQLVLSAQDSLGSPIAGVQLLVTQEDGTTHQLTTDENGEALFSCARDQALTVSETALPEGVFAARSVTGSSLISTDAAAACAQVEVRTAQRSRVTFGHPASGAVQLNMTLGVIDDNAQIHQQPLADVRLDILGDAPVSIVTDGQGQARASLLEGTYDVRLSYEGGEDILLPISEGQMIVQSGATTLIELSASQTTGRIMLLAAGGRAVSGGSVSFVSDQTGDVFGPYMLDAEGMAVSDTLPAGVYHVEDYAAPQGAEFGGVTGQGIAAATLDELALTVCAGQVTQADVALLTREQQTFELLLSQIDEQGAMQQTRMEDALSFALVSADGETVAHVDAQGGSVSVEALSGSYMLVLDEQDADRLGVLPASGVFALPAREETIVFSSTRTRLVLASVDENGMPAAGASYAVTDSEGERFTVECDGDGVAVTPLLAPGEARIETIAAPQLHDAAQDVTASAVAGEAARVEIVHPAYGSVQVNVMLQSLDEMGNAQRSPLAGVGVYLYRVSDDGQQMTDTGIVLVSGEDGAASVQLEPGEYVAQADAQDLAQGSRAPQAFRFAVENTQSVTGELVCMDAIGGVRVRLTAGELNDQLLAQVRFELVSQNGEITDLTMQDGAFYVGSLPAGTYVLRQTQMPEGYALADERTVSVAGGEVAAVDVPLEEYALLTVSKTGLTFDDALKTYVVPLSGQYGVYTMDDGAMKAYPSEGSQITVWANVTPEQIAEGRADSARLPASVDGTTYYLHEIGSVQGFVPDENYYEITLRAGEEQTLSCAVSSDRGFFSLDLIDSATGMHIPGGAFELLDAAGGERVLAFELDDEAYRNAMAIPVGEYLLRQTEAAEGYALSAQPEMPVSVEPYLTQGGTVSSVQMQAERIPQTAALDVIADVYAAEEQGLTLLTVDAAALGQGETLLAPEMTIAVGADGEERSNIVSLVLSGVGDAQGGSYAARVEYCLEGGGWQPSDARMTGVISAPTAVSLADVQDDVSAVRVTYLNAQTGEEAVLGGFTPGQMTLSVEASAQGTVNMHADAAFAGVFAYRTAFGGSVEEIARGAQASLSFAMQADGLFDTVSPGRDGRISGVAFFDEDADGVMDAGETGRYAGMTVSLLTLDGDMVDSCRTGTDGAYAFDAIPGGEYRVQFDAGEAVVFSEGGVFSQHMISGVADTRGGMSRALTISGDQTDYIVHAGCIYASEVSGAVLEQVAVDAQEGFGGLIVEMRALDADEDDEPLVVVTDETGAFGFSRVLPGAYEIALQLPEGYLSADAQDGRIIKQIELAPGDSAVFGAPVLAKASAIYGAVRVDDDGDGVFEEGALGLSGARVALLQVENGYTKQIAETVSDADGAYAFEHLYTGEYSVLFELNGEWAFTRYGEDSKVYGAVSQSGSTRPFALQPGEAHEALDVGVTIPAQLSVSVFKDEQYDGQKGPYEAMLPDVSVSLIRLENGEDAEEVTYKTDEEGSVVFAGVSPGEYVLAYQMPGQWRSTRQVDPATTNYPVSSVPQSPHSAGRSEPFVLTMGQTGVRLYIGAMLSGSISGTVYYDDDADAKLGENEAFCPGMGVELLNQDGTAIASAESGSDGSYAFEGLAPGRYAVRFTAQEGVGFSGTERTIARGGVQASDEHIAATRLITVDSGSATETADAGVVRLGSVSGRIWEDRNADCVSGEGESGLAGLTVNLMNGAGRVILETTTTDEQGDFTFGRMRPGDYMLRVDGPDGYVFSGAQAGSALPLASERDGRGYSAPFTLLGGVHVQGLGFGMLTQGVISGLVWEDADYDGLMEAEEPGLRGVKVTLTDMQGEQIASTQTIRSGEFTFDQVMPGEYALCVELGEGYAFTADGADSLAPHDDVSSTTLQLGTLQMGGTIADVRIGALKPASIGGMAWMDQDDDGRRQQGDMGVPGVIARLEMTGGADRGKVYEAATDETGAYRFDGLMPGSATISFTLEDGQAFSRQASGTRRVSSVPMANALTAQTAQYTLASGMERMDIDVGVVGVGTITGSVWEDGAYDGRQDASERGVAGAQVDLVNAASGEIAASATTDESGAYAIGFARVGEYTLRVTLPGGMIFTRSGESAIADVDASEASTQAFSLAMGESRSGVRIGALYPAVIAGGLFVDENENNLYDEGEAGMPGAVVTAMQGGTVVATAQTAADGSYRFDTLRPGSYRLRMALGADALFARESTLRLNDPDALEGETGEYTLAAGQAQTMDPVLAVYEGRIQGRAWMDEDVNGAIGAQEAAMPGVQVELLDASGSPLAKTAADENGAYCFARLRSGTYSLRFTLDEEVLFTDYTGEAAGSCVPVVPGYAGVSEPFALGMGEKRLTMNVGGILPGAIGDTVWFDQDGNGLQDYKEPLIPGVSLTLLRVAGDGQTEELATVQSDKYGYYAFESLRPGSYVLRLDAQQGDSLTFSFGAPLGEIDSDLDPDTGVSDVIELRSGQTLRNVDVGLTEHAED